MNPSPTLRQLQTLASVEQGRVWYSNGEWWTDTDKGTSKATSNVRRLWQLGFVKVPVPLSNWVRPKLTEEGAEALEEARK